MTVSNTFDGTLTPEQLETYHKNGYLVIPNYFTSTVADSLKSHSDVLIDSIDLTTHPMTKFNDVATDAISQKHNDSEHKQSESERQADINETYFLNSADTIGAFFEDAALNSNGKLTVPKQQAFNKIGHSLHIDDPEFKQFTINDTVRNTVKSIGFHDPIVLQSMTIFKHPRIGGKVDIHRDSTFLYTEPSTCVGFWFALEDCTTTNGCLSFVPGSHIDKLSDKRLKRLNGLTDTVNNITLQPNVEQTKMNTRPNNSHIKLDFAGSDKSNYTPEQFIVEPVAKGSLVIIHGDVVHSSTANTSDKSRYIYTFHCIEAENTKYPNTNWLQSSKPFTHLFA